MRFGGIEKRTGARVTLRAYTACLMDVAGWAVVRAVGLMVMCSFTEGLSVALLFPILQIAGLNLQQGQPDYYARMAERAFTAAGLHPTLLMVLGVLLLLTGARALLGRMQSVAMLAVEQNFALSLRQRLYLAITNANWLFLCRSRSADFTHALTAEVERAAQATYMLLMLVADLIVSAVYMVIAIELSWKISAVVLAAGSALILMMRGRTRALHRSGVALSSAMNHFYAGAVEHLQNLKTAKAYGAQERNFARFRESSQSVAAAYMATARQQASAAAWFECGSVLVLCGVLYASVRALKLPPAVIIVLLVVFSRLMPRFMSGHNRYRNFISLLPAFATVMEVEQRCAQAVEPTDSNAQSVPFRSAIQLAGVCFSYRPDLVPAVRSLDLVIPAGKIVALTGASGAGKSTIADLVMGLLVPGSGRITIDGATLTPRNAARWREQIGYVAHETVLFDLSVRENLRWARPDASDAEIMDALELAAAREFVVALPEGLDTVVGERAILLSQGERQRLALARALLRRPALLILDEATNSLDPENETRIMSAIERLRGAHTVLLIAHRLSTIRWADLIYIVERGAVIESGGWDELGVRDNGRLRALCEAQDPHATADRNGQPHADALEDRGRSDPSADFGV